MPRGNKKKNQNKQTTYKPPNKAVKKEEKRDQKWETATEVEQTIENIYGVEASCKIGVDFSIAFFFYFLVSNISLASQKKLCFESKLSPVH